MTDDDREIQYLADERLGILLQGRREPTEAELSAAHLEAVSIVMRRRLDNHGQQPKGAN